MQSLALCDFDPGSYLVFGPNVGPLQYYSHLPVIVIALGLGFFILLNNRRIPGLTLFCTIISYALWVFFDSVIWATNRSDVIMFMWSLQVLIEPLVYVGCLYLLHALIDKKDVSFQKKLTWFILYLPLIVLVPTSLVLSGFDITSCLANETLFSYYSYVIELIFVIWIVFLLGDRYRKAQIGSEKIGILYLGLGTLLLLVAFSWGNFVGSFTEDWQLAQYGLFGLPVFTAFLVYSIIKFKAFNIKVVGAVALVIALIASTFALLFVSNPTVFKQVSGLTFALSLVFGFMLIRGVQREVKQREEIQILAENLKQANEKLKELDKLKSEFLSIASHDLRAPLTIIRNFVSLLMDGTYGKFTGAAEEGLKQVFDRASDMAKSVDTYLNVSRIEQGRMKYDFIDIELAPLIKKAVSDFKTNADKKGIALSLSIAPNLEGKKAHLDVAKINEVLNNLLDNSIKYTPKGSIVMSVEKQGNMAHIVMQDTGIGMSPQTIGKLFKLFSTGENSIKVNTSSTGVGLYITKAHVEAHGGKIRAESDGEGKGSRFIMELPLLN